VSNGTDDPGEKSTEEKLAEGTLLSHLVELRQRLVRIAIAVAVVFVCLLPFMQEIFVLVAKPATEALPAGKLIAINPASPVFTPLKLTFFVALFLAMPIVLHQLWAFVAPGLYRREKRFALPLLATSIVLFYAGIAFAFLVVFPLMFRFFTSAAPAAVDVQTDIAEYLDFITTIVFAFGLAFEVPIATVLVVWTGLTSPAKLSRARPYVFLIAFVVGMFLTPPDVISQTLLAIPIYLLYELGIVMSRIFALKPEEAGDEPGSGD